MRPLRTLSYRTKVEKRPFESKLEGEQPHKLELPEMLDSIGLKLMDAVYIEPGQKYSTMGQIRLMEWIDKHKSAPVAMTKTHMEFQHQKKAKETATKKLRTTVQFKLRHLAVDIYLLEGNSNLAKQLLRVKTMLEKYNPEVIVVVVNTIIPVVEKIRTSIARDVGKYHKYNNYDPGWELLVRTEMQQIDERCDALTMKLVEKGGKQEAAIAAMHRQIKPFSGNAAISIFEFLHQVEMATTSMGNQQERSSIVINQYLDEKI